WQGRRRARMQQESGTKTHAGFAKAPGPPYNAVIFTSQRTEGDRGYEAMAHVMFELALKQPSLRRDRRMLRVQLSLATLLATTSLTQAQTPIERGSYLVNGLLTCGNCHTPRGPGGAFAMDRQLSGGPQEWDRPTYKVRGANITPDKETGNGNWRRAVMRRGDDTD